MKTYKLTKTTKGANHTYTVTDERGTILSKRVSKRDYVACTIDGRFYFGRLDLISKGDHGQYLKHYQNNPEKKKELDGISTIAYLALCDCKDFTIKGKVFVCKECGKEHKSLSA